HRSRRLGDGDAALRLRLRLLRLGLGPGLRLRRLGLGGLLGTIPAELDPAPHACPRVEQVTERAGILEVDEDAVPVYLQAVDGLTGGLEHHLVDVPRADLLVTRLDADPLFDDSDRGRDTPAVPEGAQRRVELAHWLSYRQVPRRLLRVLEGPESQEGDQDHYHEHPDDRHTTSDDPEDARGLRGLEIHGIPTTFLDGGDLPLRHHPCERRQDLCE